MGVGRSELKMSESRLKQVKLDDSGLHMSGNEWNWMVVGVGGWEWVGASGNRWEWVEPRLFKPFANMSL